MTRPPKPDVPVELWWCELRGWWESKKMSRTIEPCPIHEKDD